MRPHARQQSALFSRMLHLIQPSAFSDCSKTSHLPRVTCRRISAIGNQNDSRIGKKPIPGAIPAATENAISPKKIIADLGPPRQRAGKEERGLNLLALRQSNCQAGDPKLLGVTGFCVF